jgi:hypothetical protein
VIFMAASLLVYQFAVKDRRSKKLPKSQSQVAALTRKLGSAPQQLDPRWRAPHMRRALPRWLCCQSKLECAGHSGIASSKALQTCCEPCHSAHPSDFKRISNALQCLLANQRGLVTVLCGASPNNDFAASG